MRETVVERRLKWAITARGGRCLKWVCPGNRGVPDRICLMPGGRIAFVETKAPGKRVDQAGLQGFWQRTLRGLGFTAEVLSTIAEVDEWVERWAGPVPRD